MTTDATDGVDAIEALFGIILTVLTACFRWMSKKLKTVIAEQTANNNGTKALLRDRIIQAYNHYMERGERRGSQPAQRRKHIPSG